MGIFEYVGKLIFKKCTSSAKLRLRLTSFFNVIPEIFNRESIF